MAAAAEDDGWHRATGRGAGEISNRKESGGRRCLYGGCSPFHSFIPRGDGACYVVDGMRNCTNSTASRLREVF